MILVTGATGNAGAQVVRALVKEGQEVRAFVRDADKGYALFGDAVERAVGDFADPKSVRTALAGAKALFLNPHFAQRQRPGPSASSSSGTGRSH
jgi:uncharacterized protein YbjT (DUF2867 family)